MLDTLKNTMTITHKFTLFPIGDKEEVDRVYKYIRNGQELQSWMMNRCITALYNAKQSNATKEELAELRRRYSQLPTDRNPGSAYYDIDIEKFPKGIKIPGAIPRIVESKLDAAYKNGLKYGRVSLPTYKADMPMYCQKNLLVPEGDKARIGNAGLNHRYETMEDLMRGLKNDKDPEVYIQFANKINFKIVFDKAQGQIRSDLKKIFGGEYGVCDSQIGIRKNKIVLWMSLSVPKKESRLDENVCVGVDLGITVPAVCALNINLYKRLYIGSFEELTAYKTKRKEMLRRLQSSMKNARGGHGRNRKYLDKMKKYEAFTANYSRTYNHKVSKQIIDFALQNNAAYINLEDLHGIKERADTENENIKILLNNWSLFELQQMIKYKAESYGIKVRFIDPAFTSQTCSVCGKRGMRLDQKTFLCTNPYCNCKEVYRDFGKAHFADFNAARNIATSTIFVEEGENSSKTKAGKAKKKREYAEKTA